MDIFLRCSKSSRLLAAKSSGKPSKSSVGRLLFAFYVVNYFVIVFFNSALIACAIIRFKGGNPTIGNGFSAAFSRMPQILGWALVAATVGLILKIIESRSEKLGALVAGLLGMAWSAVTYFVVPVIVVEQAGPVQAGRRSLDILKKTWGEALTANFGIGFIVFLASLAGIIPLVLGVVALATENVILGICGIVIGVTALLIISLHFLGARCDHHWCALICTPPRERFRSNSTAPSSSTPLRRSNPVGPGRLVGPGRRTGLGSARGAKQDEGKAGKTDIGFVFGNNAGVVLEINWAAHGGWSFG